MRRWIEEFRREEIDLEEGEGRGRRFAIEEDEFMPRAIPVNAQWIFRVIMQDQAETVDGLRGIRVMSATSAILTEIPLQILLARAQIRLLNDQEKYS
uniref:Uncharacterized protein n=1 Tax=Angiostrongylus cantonensis TaxID=6313 RepID=A0A0K0D7R4_ANGCA